MIDQQFIQRLVPNIISEGIGDTTLCDRISDFIAQSTEWYDRNIAPAKQPMTQSAEAVIALRALWLAAPALDVTMHPNGLAVVNTDSLAPASADRSRGFRDNIARRLAERIDNLVATELAKTQEWLDTPQARATFTATVCISIQDACDLMGKPYTWEGYIESIPGIATAEENLVEKILSEPLLTRIRRQTADPGLLNPAVRESEQTYTAARLIRACAARIAKGIPADKAVLQRLINLIRDNPSTFPEWHSSPVARLYTPPVFRNTKTSGGYFF